MRVCVVCRNVASLGAAETVGSVFSMISKYFVINFVRLGLVRNLYLCYEVWTSHLLKTSHVVL